MKKYVYRKYNPKYKKYFLSEKKKILKAVGLNIKIEHIGSTAIPGLGGKGIIDMVVGTTKTNMHRTKRKLKEAGYEFREMASTLNRYFFRKDYNNKKTKRRIHIHLVLYNKHDWMEMVGFRNYLFGNPEKIHEYIKIKREAVKIAKGNGVKYKEHKEKFIKKILGLTK